MIAAIPVHTRACRHTLVSHVCARLYDCFEITISALFLITPSLTHRASLCLYLSLISLSPLSLTHGRCTNDDDKTYTNTCFHSHRSLHTYTTQPLLEWTDVSPRATVRGFYSLRYTPLTPDRPCCLSYRSSALSSPSLSHTHTLSCRCLISAQSSSHSPRKIGRAQETLCCLSS